MKKKQDSISSLNAKIEQLAQLLRNQARQSQKTKRSFFPQVGCSNAISQIARRLREEAHLAESRKKKKKAA